jgi:polyisoprenoid-binding protein YceI
VKAAPVPALVAAVLAAVAVAAAPVARAAPPLEAGPADGEVHVKVAKRGAFSMFAHDHDFVATRWSARAEVPGGDPARATVAVTVGAGSLHDREAKLSAGDRAKVDAQAAGPEVLDAARFPEITFRAERATVEGGAADGKPLRGTLHGALTLHGQTHPVDAAFEASAADGGWRVRGTARFAQSRFGIRPFSGFGGTVGVKDDVEVAFAFTLRPGGGAGGRSER